MHHVHAGQQPDGEHDIHGGTSNGDDETMPARMR